MTQNGLFLSAGTIYDPENPAHRKELGDKLTEKLGAIGFRLSDDRTRDPGRKYGGFKGKEQVYVFKHRKDPGLEVQVFTSVLDSGSVRGKGADAIRVCLVYKNKAKQENPEGAEAKQFELGSGCRVYRTGDIDDIVSRTVDRAREMYVEANKVDRCQYCQAPMALSKQGKKFCSEVCWTKRPGYTPKASALEAAADKPVARSRARSLIDSQIDADDAVVKDLEKFMTDPANWPFFSAWPERLWKGFLKMQKKVIDDAASGVIDEEESAGEMKKVSQQQETPATEANASLTKDIEDLLAEVEAAVDIGKHPDLFSEEPTAVSIEDWKMASPEDLLAAARGGAIPHEDDLEEMKELQEQAEEDGNVDALLALGMSRSLAEAVADGLADELYAFDEEGREARIEAFVKEFRERAEGDIQYETEGDGKENYFDYFQSSALSGRELRNIVKEVQEYLEEDEYPRAQDVTDEVLSGILEDPDIYDFQINKNEYRRSPRAVWSGGLGSLSQERDGADYDEDLADLLRPLSEEDLAEACKQLENNSPYVSFGSSWRREKINKGYFEGSYSYQIGETEGWRWEAIVDMAKVMQALDEALGVSEGQEAEAEDVIYRYAGTNDTVAGASARGMYVVRLKPSQLGKEGADLGICVGRKDMPYCRRLKAGEIDLYSIRTESGKSKFTIEIDKVRNQIAQVKGKANRVPGFAAGRTDFAKADDVRLATDFLLHLGFSPSAIRSAYDMEPGVKAMEDAGQDPFTPPPTKKRGEIAANSGWIAASLKARVLAVEALSRPWGFGVEAVAERAMVPRRVAHYHLFEEWLSGLKDKKAAGALLKRINRIKEDGFFGDVKTVRSGLYELRVDMGPGYRAYYTDMEVNGEPTIVFINGGDKKSQDKDIETAENLMEIGLSGLRVPGDESEAPKKEFKDYGAEFMPKPMFENISDEELLAAGVPAKLLMELRSLLAGDEDGLLDIADRVPIGASQFLIDFALKHSAVSGSVKIQCKMIELKAKELLV